MKFAQWWGICYRAKTCDSIPSTNDSDSALAYSARVSKKTMASANIPAAAANFQQGVVARVGGEGMNAVASDLDRCRPGAG